MNREIKFKCWVGGKTMLTLESTTEAHNHYLQMGSGGFWLYASDTGKLMGSLKAGDVLIQFTGLLDKNGKEIYEGDILQAETNGLGTVRHLVKWDNENAMFEMWSPKSLFEIIGNIYSNPELIKQP